MADSITPGNMPMGCTAYLGYVDGNWPTASRLPELFPGARYVSLTVLGSTLSADGVDCEEGNPINAHRAAVWAHDKLAASPGSRPVMYADLATPGYSMSEVLQELAGLGVNREQVRVLTAHYGSQRICSAAAGCKDKDGKLIAFTADGTQWTDEYPGINGSKIDMSLLADDFFGPPPGWVFTAVRGLVGTHGPHSLRLTWSSPGQPAPEAVHHYQVTVRLAGRDIRGFPVTVPKTGVQESVQWDGVERGTYDQAMVRAVAVGGHASPWASVTFPGQA
jgi:hypothetical protein